MALKSYQVRVDRLNGLQVKASTRGFELILDEPETSGGSNTGMNPVELMLCSVAACQTITTIIYADFYGIPLDTLWVEMEGALDPIGFTGSDPTVRPGFQTIKSVFHIQSKAPAVQLEQLLLAVERVCPVGDSVRNGVKISAPTLIME